MVTIICRSNRGYRFFHSKAKTEVGYKIAASRTNLDNDVESFFVVEGEHDIIKPNRYTLDIDKVKELRNNHCIYDYAFAKFA